ncbi:hypothetical protein [Falsigemmobacter faecalis]|uniref:Dihydroxy-acid dehydratase n=1 Tax=Falsigemmobacter faecalis TaxID=2488730 RepID=A0A3P3DSC2_9RHOB|nr:hypothetical protein [Falsigemmobacter faecalis]RRH76844.1 hypothetical protein EG244_04335 [Falsigemmobacter faecalis]
MSIWTSKVSRAAAGTALALALSGCQMTSAPGPEKQSRFSGPPPSKMAVAGGQLIVSGPRGYCIDRESSRDDAGAAALVVLSPCRGLGAGLFAERAAHEAVMTAAVGARPMVAEPGRLLPAMQAFAATDQGLAALSRSGAAQNIQVRHIFAEGDVVYMRLTDRGQFAWGIVQPDYWRAVVPAGGRMLSLSVLALPQSPLSDSDGLRLLRDFVATVQAGSALPATSG